MKKKLLVLSVLLVSVIFFGNAHADLNIIIATLTPGISNRPRDRGREIPGD